VAATGSAEGVGRSATAIIALMPDCVSYKWQIAVALLVLLEVAAVSSLAHAFSDRLSIAAAD
jgi:hypothetical protein